MLNPALVGPDPQVQVQLSFGRSLCSVTFRQSPASARMTSGTAGIVPALMALSSLVSAYIMAQEPVLPGASLSLSPGIPLSKVIPLKMDTSYARTGADDGQMEPLSAGAAGGALPVNVSFGNPGPDGGAVRSGSGSRAFVPELCSVFITRKMPQAPLSSDSWRPL